MFGKTSLASSLPSKCINKIFLTSTVTFVRTEHLSRRHKELTASTSRIQSALCNCGE